MESRALLTTFTVTSTDDSGPGSLRQAILEANSNPGTDLIAFNLSGSGVHTITPNSALPDVTDPAVIDGTTQPGYAGAPLVKLDGTNAGVNSGLVVTAGNSTIKGLDITHFTQNAIALLNAGNNTVQANFLGTDPSGTVAEANDTGVYIASASNLIGGTTPQAANLLSGNGGHGVFLDGVFAANIGVSATNNTVQGNLIGTDITGTQPLGNGLRGVFLSDAPNNLIGGTAPGAGNLISANRNIGIQLTGDQANGNRIQGNLIGTTITGRGNLGNRLSGVTVFGFNNLIGGSSDTAGNVIAFNQGPGVRVTFGTGNTIRHNSIFSNTGLGIDLGRTGVTPNDLGDTDTGPNNLQNFPVLLSASRRARGVQITGALNSTPNTTFLVDFYANRLPNSTDYTEGRTHIGSTTVTTDASGNASFSSRVNRFLPARRFITATATVDAAQPNAGDTSEFSSDVRLPSPGRRV